MNLYRISYTSLGEMIYFYIVAESESKAMEQKIKMGVVGSKNFEIYGDCLDQGDSAEWLKIEEDRNTEHLKEIGKI